MNIFEWLLPKDKMQALLNEIARSTSFKREEPGKYTLRFNYIVTPSKATVELTADDAEKLEDNEAYLFLMKKYAEALSKLIELEELRSKE